MLDAHVNTIRAREDKKPVEERKLVRDVPLFCASALTGDGIGELKEWLAQEGFVLDGEPWDILAERTSHVSLMQAEWLDHVALQLQQQGLQDPDEILEDLHRVGMLTREGSTQIRDTTREWQKSWSAEGTDAEMMYGLPLLWLRQEYSVGRIVASFLHDKDNQCLQTSFGEPWDSLHKRRMPVCIAFLKWLLEASLRLEASHSGAAFYGMRYTFGDEDWNSKFNEGACFVWLMVSPVSATRALLRKTHGQSSRLTISLAHLFLQQQPR